MRISDWSSDVCSSDLRMLQSGERPTLEANPHYLLEVDKMLVMPVDTKVRFVITADDVIHSWWVPALGWKQDAIPGIVNEAWARSEERRLGKEWGSTRRSRGSPSTHKKKQQYN